MEERTRIAVHSNLNKILNNKLYFAPTSKIKRMDSQVHQRQYSSAHEQQAPAQASRKGPATMGHQRRKKAQEETAGSADARSAGS